MTKGNPMKLLFFFALPLMFGNVFQQLYTVIDTAIVGRGVGMDALAALGTVDWLSWMLLGIAQGFSQGFSVRISQKYGERDMAGLKYIVGQSARLSVLIAIVCVVLSQTGLTLLLDLLRVPAELRGMAGLYTRILFAGFPAVMFFNYCSAVLRAIGDSKTPLKAMITASIINILLDVFTVFILKWGIAGAAGATVVSQCLSGVICAVKISKTPELHFEKEHLQLQSNMSRNLMKMGAPIAAKNIIVALGGIVIQMIVNGFGMSFIAGFTASNKLYGLLEFAALSYGFAVTTYVGQNYGAGDLERIKTGMKVAIKLALTTAVLIATIMILFGRPITMLFISSDVPAMAAAAGDTAYLFLVVMSVSLPILYLLYIYQAALQGMGNTVVSMISGSIQLVLRVSGAIIIGITGYENGIFGAEVIAWFGGAMFLMLTYYRTIHKEIKEKYRS